MAAYDKEPTFKSNLLVYEGRYYLIGEEHKEFISDKMTDSDYYILTLAAVARELNIRKLTSARVHLAVGLPLTWVSEQKDSFKAYLLQNEAVDFAFRGIDYHDWMKQQFVDIAFTYLTSMLYYEDYDRMRPEQRLLMQQGMEAFGGIAPTYRIALLDKPTIVWDFHSLMLGIQMMFSFMLTDSEKPVRLCRHCTKAFVASRPSAVFCSPQCKNKFNVYKSRNKNTNKDGE